MTVDGARPAPTPPERPSPLASAGLRLSDWFERWFPDAFSLALAAAVLVYCMLQFLVHVPPIVSRLGPELHAAVHPASAALTVVGES